MRCNATGMPRHWEGRTVERNKTKGGVKRRQMLGQKLVSPWAKMGVKSVLARPTTRNSAASASGKEATKWEM
jgi:hypothetical protein